MERKELEELKSEIRHCTTMIKTLNAEENAPLTMTVHLDNGSTLELNDYTERNGKSLLYHACNYYYWYRSALRKRFRNEWRKYKRKQNK